ncbi:MAG: OmpA family protein [Mariprofundaceae bacterium]
MLNRKVVSVRSLMLIPMLMLSVSAAQAVTMGEVETRMAEAEQLRALEFSPEHFAEAKEALENARSHLASGNNDKARRALENSDDHFALAIKTSQLMSSQFSGLVESRDRMQMADPTYLRDDLVERAERDFSRVVESVEDGDVEKAGNQAKMALSTMRAAQVVASREQYVRPVSRGVAAARKIHARKYAPNSLGETIAIQKKVQHLIKNDPDAQVKMYALSKQGEKKAKRTMKIAALGDRLSKNPAEIETLVYSEEARFRLIAKYLGIDLSSAKDAEEQAMLLQQAITEMEQNYQHQLQDSDKTIEELSGKLAKYEGELSQYESDLASMAELRRKLQIKRDAEIKIKRLTKLFNRDQVEIHLTPDSDVILRMNSLNFRSGSAVIPPNKYIMLDGASQSMVLFADRAVQVEGHTDAVGANLFNQKLSERRAQAVKTYLIEKLEGKRVIQAVGFGEEKPIANNETSKGKEKNRRIDIILLAPRL